MHEIKIELPDLADEVDEISFTLNNLPCELHDMLARFTRIPDYDRILRFVVAYELLPLTGLKNIPFIFCTGPSGSGKSTLGEILQRLNPRSNANIAGLTAGDTYKGWEQSLPFFKYDVRGIEKAFPLLTIDDLEPRNFNGDVGALKLHYLKQIVNSNGVFTRGSADGTPIEIKAFCKLCTGSIHDLPSLEGLQELERRVMRIRTKNITEWSDEEHTELTLSTPMEDHSEFHISTKYDEIRHIYINEHAEEMMKNRAKCNKLLRESGSSLIPKNRHGFFSPIIALSSTLFGLTLESEIQCFAECFLNESTKDAESSLVKLVRAWLNAAENPYKARQAILHKYGEGYSIKYSEVNKFLKIKQADGELDRRGCGRDEVISCMSTLGFNPKISGTDTLFCKGECE